MLIRSTAITFPVHRCRWRRRRAADWGRNNEIDASGSTTHPVVPWESADLRRPCAWPQRTWFRRPLLSRRDLRSPANQKIIQMQLLIVIIVNAKGERAKIPWTSHRDNWDIVKRLSAEIKATGEWDQISSIVKTVLTEYLFRTFPQKDLRWTTQPVSPCGKRWCIRRN